MNEWVKEYMNERANERTNERNDWMGQLRMGLTEVEKKRSQ